MNLKINNDLPIKYHLNMHLMESFIEKDSIGFEIIKYVIGDIATHKKEMEIENFKFTSKTLKYIFGDRIKEPDFKDFVIKTIKEFIANDLIVPKNKALHITEKMITNFYNIN